MSPNLHTIARRLGVIGTLCLLQVAGAVVAAVAVWTEVESIIVAGPALAILGLVIATIALRVKSRRLLNYGLWHPLASAAFALAIANFEWGPGDAQSPARILFVANLCVIGPWGKKLLARSNSVAYRRPTHSRGLGIRFSLRGALVATTVLCVLLAFAVRLTWRGEGPFFTLYALVMLALASLYFYIAHGACRTS